MELRGGSPSLRRFSVQKPLVSRRLPIQIQGRAARRSHVFETRFDSWRVTRCFFPPPRSPSPLLTTPFSCLPASLRHPPPRSLLPSPSSLSSSLLPAPSDFVSSFEGGRFGGSHAFETPSPLLAGDPLPLLDPPSPAFCLASLLPPSSSPPPPPDLLTPQPSWSLRLPSLPLCLCSLLHRPFPFFLAPRPPSPSLLPPSSPLPLLPPSRPSSARRPKLPVPRPSVLLLAESACASK